MRNSWATGLIFAIACIASPASSEPAAWDQEDATRLALEVVSELRATQKAAEALPHQPSVLQQRKRDAAFFQLRHTISAAEELHSKLSEGWDRDVTEAYVRTVRIEALRISEIYGDAQPYRKPFEHWEAAKRAGRKLQRYYADGSASTDR